MTTLVQGRANLREISHLKEAESLVRAMLVAAPKRRPSVASVMAHPFWWPPQRRLSFLVHLSDRMENEDREVRPPLPNPTIIGCPFYTSPLPVRDPVLPPLSTIGYCFGGAASQIHLCIIQVSWFSAAEEQGCTMKRLQPHACGSCRGHECLSP